MGVHPHRRRQGHGRAITLAGVAALAQMGCSSEHVSTETSNLAALATYRSAGFETFGELPDLARD